MKKHIIWSNRDIDFDQWKEDYIEYRKEFEYEEPENVSDDDVWAFIHDSLSIYLDDEMANLDRPTDGRMIAIASLGLWNGRVPGYRILGRNANEIFRASADYTEWYSDGHNIRATATHHDGTNFYEFRVIREDRNIDNLLNAIYSGEQITRKKLNYYTRSLQPYIARAYGW